MHTQTHTETIPKPELASVQFYLTIASAVTLVFGLLIAAAAWPPAAVLIEPLTRLILWQETVDFGTREARLLAAISGGVLAGWGLMMLLLARALAEAPLLIGRCILAGIGFWFTVDSLASLAATAPLNVIGNILFLAAFGLPAARLAGYAAPTER
ncbi:MAG: hypothetical protein AAFY59_02465 [Pseudomonadota bacterium]